MSHQNKTSDRELNQKSKNNNFLSQQIGSSNICDNRRGQDLSFTKIWRKKWVKSNTLVYIVQTLFQKYPIDFINWQTIQNKQKSNWHSNKWLFYLWFQKKQAKSCSIQYFALCGAVCSVVSYIPNSTYINFREK